jgi:hypothetical protein
LLACDENSIGPLPIGRRRSLRRGSGKAGHPARKHILFDVHDILRPEIAAPEEWFLRECRNLRRSLAHFGAAASASIQAISAHWERNAASYPDACDDVDFGAARATHQAGSRPQKPVPAMGHFENDALSTLRDKHSTRNAVATRAAQHGAVK